MNENSAKTSENIDIEHKISLRVLPVLPLFLQKQSRWSRHWRRRKWIRQIRVFYSAAWNIPHVLKIFVLSYCEHFMDVMMCLNRDIKIRYKCQRTYTRSISNRWEKYSYTSAKGSQSLHYIYIFYSYQSMNN